MWLCAAALSSHLKFSVPSHNIATASVWILPAILSYLIPRWKNREPSYSWKRARTFFVHPQSTAFSRLLRLLFLALLLFQPRLQPWGFPCWLLLLTTPWNGHLTSLFEVRSIFWPFPWFYVTNFSWPVYWLTASPLYLLPPSPQDPILSHAMHGLAELILTWGSLSMLLPISLDCRLLSRISSCYSKSPSYLTAGLSVSVYRQHFLSGPVWPPTSWTPYHVTVHTSVYPNTQGKKS